MPTCVFALLGLIVYGAGYWLRQTSYEKFSGPAEKLGNLALLFCAYLLTWRDSWYWYGNKENACHWLLPVMVVLAVAALAGVLKGARLSRQWQWTWAAMLMVMAGLLAGAFYTPRVEVERYWRWHENFNFGNTFATIALFAFCLVQIQVGLMERSRSLVNLAIAAIAVIIITTYIQLFDTMLRTGLMFIISGVFLIVFGVFLEKRRRKLIRQIKNPISLEVQ